MKTNNLFISALIPIFLHIFFATSYILSAQNSNTVGAIPSVLDVSPMGVATYTIPIEVVPGTKGIQPNLSVVYSSNSGIGLLGMKWNLAGLSSITRCGQIPYYDETTTAITYNKSDKFALDGERLLQISNGVYGGNEVEYATEMENFTRVISYKSAGSETPDYFTAFTDDGTIIEYGNSVDSKLNMGYWADPYILSWCINKITDANGNCMTFNYTLLNGEILIDNIQYTGSVGIQPYSKVKFSYRDLPETLGKNTYFVGGFGVQQTKLIESIAVSYKDTTVRKYEFEYVHDTDPQGERTAHLKKIVLREWSESGEEQLNPTTIEWGNKNFYLLQKTIYDLPQGNIIAGDFDGDGYSDLLVYGINSNNKGWKLYLFNPVTSNYYLKTTSSTSTNYDLLYAQDLNGDGKHELIIGMWNKNGNTSNPYMEFSVYTISAGGEKRIAFLPSYYFNNQYCEVKFGDFDGDGSTDMLLLKVDLNTKPVTKSITVYHLSYNNFKQLGSINDIKGNRTNLIVLDANGNGNQNIQLKNYDEDTTYIYEYNGSSFTIVLGKPTHHSHVWRYYGDLNGDGITDALSFYNDTSVIGTYYWKVFIALGNGFLAEKNINFNALDRTPADGSSGPAFPVVFADINGDGKEDIIQGIYNNNTNTTTFNILLSKGYTNGNFNYTKYSVSATGNLELREKWAFGDHNNNGHFDIILKDKNSGIATIIYFYQDNNYELVTEITDGLDKKIKLSYEQKYCIAKSKQRVPQYPNSTYSCERKFFFTLVSKVQISNGLGIDLNTLQYQYITPAFSMLRKTFLGFNEFIITNNSENKKEHHFFDFTNYYNYHKQILLLWKKLSYCNDENTILKRAANSLFNLDNGTRFICTASGEEIDYLSNITTTNNTIYNNQGRVIKYFSHTYNGTSPNINNCLLLDTTTYFYKGICLTNKFQKKTVIEKIATIQQYGINSNIIYDTLIYSYSSTGNLLREQRVNKDGSIKTEYGNYTPAGLCQIKTVSAEGCIPRNEFYKYDNTNRFVTSIKNNLNHETKFYYDAKTGNKTLEIDPNGLITTYQYGAFGNLKQVTYPDKTKTIISFNWFSSPQQLPNAKYISTTSSSGKQNLIIYYDILGREICRKEDGFFSIRFTIIKV